MSKARRINLGILVDKPYPHPNVRDKKELIRHSFDLSHSIFDLYEELVGQKELELADRLLKASLPVRKRIEDCLSERSGNEYVNNLSLAIDALSQTRYWLKMVQMKYAVHSLCDETVELTNELIIVLNYMLYKFDNSVHRKTIFTPIN